MRVSFRDDLSDALRTIIMRGDDKLVAEIIENFSEREGSVLFDLWTDFARALTGFSTCALPVRVERHLKRLADRETQLPHDRMIEAWSILAFLKGYLQRSGEPARIRDDVQAQFSEVYSRAADAIGLVLKAAAAAGSWCAHQHAKEASRPTLIQIPTQFSGLLDALIALPKHPDAIAYGALEGATLVFSAITLLAAREPANSDTWKLVLKASVEFTEKPVLPPVREAIARLLFQAKREDVIRKWIERWCGPDGFVWREDNYSSRASTLQFFARIALGLADGGATHHSLQRSERRTRIGFVGHKEIALQPAVRWFRTLASVMPSTWSAVGLKLLHVSETASRDGDNSFSHDVLQAVYVAAALDGWPALLRLVASRRVLAGEPLRQGELEAFLLAAQRAFAKAPTQADLEAIWTATVGIFSWELDDERKFVVEVREFLLASARAHSLTFLPSVNGACEQSAVAAAADEPHRSERTVNAESITELEREWPSGRLASAPWDTFATLLRKVVESGDHRDVPRFQRLFLRRDPDFSVSFDGAARALPDLVRAGTDQARRDLLVHVAQANWDNAGAILTLCGLLHDDPTKSATWLGALLDDMSGWATVWPGRSPAAPTTLVPQQDAPQSLAAWVAMMLVESLESESADELAAALRGLGRAIQTSDATVDALAAALANADVTSLLFTLFAVEGAVTTRPAVLPRVTAIIEFARRSPHLKVRLQGWLVERAAAIRAGTTPPSFVGPPPPTARIDVIRPPPMKATVDEKHGYLNTIGENQANESVVKRLQAANEVRLPATLSNAEIERERTTAPPLHAARRFRADERRRLPPASFIALGLAVSRDMSPGGPLERASPLRIAQAFLAADEPVLAISSPPPFPDDVIAEWPTDEKARAQDLPVGALKLQMQSTLDRLARHGLAADEVLLGTSARAFTDKWDITFSLCASTARLTMRELDDLAFELPRSFAWYDDTAWRTYPGGPALACRSHGAFDLIGSSFDVVPALAIWRAAGWQPAAATPTRWTKNGEPRAWFQRFATPAKRDYLGGYRHPSLQRWVCKRQSIAELTPNASNLVWVSDVTVAPAPRR